jgi:4-hydroxy-tetrahydrodipicolinate synthase
LVVAPYYNLPSQEGLLAHFGYLAEHSDLPIVLYNVPGRTVTDLQPETVCELARRHPGRFVGIKDASGDLSRVTDHRMGITAPFVQLSGDDELALPFNAAGGVGCISVTANVAPRLCAEFQAACAAGDFAAARELNDRLYPLHYAMFEDASPGPCKYGLSRVANWFAEELRLPLVTCSDTARQAVDEALVHAGLV